MQPNRRAYPSNRKTQQKSLRPQPDPQINAPALQEQREPGTRKTRSHPEKIRAPKRTRILPHRRQHAPALPPEGTIYKIQRNTSQKEPPRLPSIVQRSRRRHRLHPEPGKPCHQNIRRPCRPRRRESVLDPQKQRIARTPAQNNPPERTQRGPRHNRKTTSKRKDYLPSQRRQPPPPRR